MQTLLSIVKQKLFITINLNIFDIVNERKHYIIYDKHKFDTRKSVIIYVQQFDVTRGADLLRFKT